MLIYVSEALFWGGLCLLAIPYLVYPALLWVLGWRKQPKMELSPETSAQPTVSVLLPVHNAEKLIQTKIENLYAAHYPLTEVWVGLDGCTDGTLVAVQALQNLYPNLKLLPQPRRGKVAMLNSLAEHAQGEIWVLTDAGAHFTPETLSSMISAFKPGVGVVSSAVVPRKHTHAEDHYLAPENRLKLLESRFGLMMGAAGACYALRREAFSVVPEDRLISDDLYLTMKALLAGWWAVLAPQALCYSLPILKDMRFQRRVRIAAGGFSTMKLLNKSLLQKPRLMAMFWAHKVLRWLSPLGLGMVLAALPVLYSLGLGYCIFAWFVVFFLATPLIELGGLRSIVIKAPAAFLRVNLAQVLGFIRFVKGPKSGVWQPTVRNIEL